MEIIAADTTHIPLIRELTMQVWPQTYTPIVGESQVNYMLDRFYSADALTQQMTVHQHYFIIGYEEGIPAAFASYSEIGPFVYKLHKLYIVSGMQGKGLGKVMVDYIVEDVRRIGGRKLRLNVNIYNDSAKSFYDKYGFVQLHDEDIDIGGGYFMNDHVLQLSLP